MEMTDNCLDMKIFYRPSEGCAKFLGERGSHGGHGGHGGSDIHRRNEFDVEP
jgi:hypothetical protein